MDYLSNFLSKDKGKDMTDDHLMAELKAMGYEEGEEGLGMDEEQAEIDRFEKELLQEEAELMKHAGGDMKEVDVDSKRYAGVRIDDKDLDDPELVGELDEIAGEETENTVKEHEDRISTLHRQAEAAKAHALALKKANRIEEAKEALKQFKLLEAQAASEEALLKAHNAAHRPTKAAAAAKAREEEEGDDMEVDDKDLDDPELLQELAEVQKGTARVKVPGRNQPAAGASKPAEPQPAEIDFDYDEIVSMSVMQFELEQAQKARDQDLEEKLGMMITVRTR